MFGTMLNETLGKITFWTFLIGFHLTFFIQHFLGLMGMPRRIWKFLPNQGLETGNLVSSIGAAFMAFGVIVMLINIVVTSVRNKELEMTLGEMDVRLNGQSHHHRLSITLNNFH